MDEVEQEIDRSNQLAHADLIRERRDSERRQRELAKHPQEARKERDPEPQLTAAEARAIILTELRKMTIEGAGVTGQFPSWTIAE